MKRILLSAATVLALSASPALSQGVPTFDGQALRQLLLQLEHMAEDLGIQHEQLTTLLGSVEELSHLTEVIFWQLVFEGTVSLRELLNHDLEDSALVDDTSKGSVDFLSH